MIKTQEAIEKVRFKAYGNAIDAWKCKEPYVFHGPAGTGKTRLNLEKAHFLLMKYPMARGIMIRKTRASMTESCMFTLEKQVIHPKDGVRFHHQEQKYIYPQQEGYDHSSEFVVRGLDDPTKIMSTEYDFAYYNEMTEVRRADVEMVRTRLRNGKIPYQFFFGDCNPDAPTHWIQLMGAEGKLKLIKSEYEDNPRWFDQKYKRWTKEGEAYIKALEENTGVRLQRLRYGRWVAAEGVVYDEFNRDLHVVPNFIPPESWARYWVIDFGYVDPFVWQNWVVDGDGRMYLYQQIYHTGRIVEDWCELIKKVTEKQPRPRAIICDHDAEGRATLERHLQMVTQAAYKNINEGINAVKKRMKLVFDGNNMVGDTDRGNPRLKVMEDTLVHNPDKALIEKYLPIDALQEIDAYVWDKNNKDDMWKDKPIDKFNHGMDAMRYIVAYMDDLADDPQEQEYSLMLGDYEDNRVIVSPY